VGVPKLHHRVHLQFRPHRSTIPRDSRVLGGLQTLGRDWRVWTQVVTTVVAIIAAVATLVAANVVSSSATSSAKNESLRAARVATFSSYLSDVTQQRENLFDNLHWLDLGDMDTQNNPAAYNDGVTSFWGSEEALQARIAGDLAEVKMLAPDGISTQLDDFEKLRADAYLIYKCRAHIQGNCPSGVQSPLPKGQRQDGLLEFLNSDKGDIGAKMNNLTLAFRGVIG